MTGAPPVSQWGLDPLFFSHPKLAIRELVGGDDVWVPAPEGNGAVHLYRGRPVRRCEMLGHVVAVNPKPGKTVFTLDDGTGCVECVVWMGIDETGTVGGAGVDGTVGADAFGVDPEGLRGGALVRIQGRITKYREAWQLAVNALQCCKDPNEEILFWVDWVRAGEDIEAGRIAARTDPGDNAG